MRYEIQIHHEDEWHTMGHTPRVFHALSLMAIYAHEGMHSRVRQIVGEERQTVAMTVSARAN